MSRLEGISISRDTRIYGRVACHVRRAQIPEECKKLPLLFRTEYMSGFVEEYVESFNTNRRANILYGFLKPLNRRDVLELMFSPGA